MPVEVGTFGVWRGETGLSAEFAAGVEELGYTAIWVGGSPGDDLAIVSSMLGATTNLSVATGIVNVWKDKAEPIAQAFHAINGQYPDRFLLGVGVGHPEATGEAYGKPYETLVHYLDILDQQEVPVSHRALAALGPKVLQLSADRTAGAHPYLVTPEHTRDARAILGPDLLLAPEQKVVLDVYPETSRPIAREIVKFYLGLQNYTNNLRRYGFTDHDLAGEGSDRLVDALVAQGSPSSVAARIREHLDAGADHVAIQLLTAPGQDPLVGLRALAAELF